MMKWRMCEVIEQRGANFLGWDDSLNLASQLWPEQLSERYRKLVVKEVRQPQWSGWGSLEEGDIQIFRPRAQSWGLWFYFSHLDHVGNRVQKLGTKFIFNFQVGWVSTEGLTNLSRPSRYPQIQSWDGVFYTPRVKPNEKWKMRHNRQKLSITEWEP